MYIMLMSRLYPPGFKRCCG